MFLSFCLGRKVATASIVLFSVITLAQESSSRSPTALMHIMPLVPGITSKDFPGDAFHVHSPKSSEAEEILPVDQRDDLLEKSNLLEATAGWDDMDKDMLLLRLRFFPMKKVVSQYPRLSKKKLRQLYEILPNKATE